MAWGNSPRIINGVEIWLGLICLVGMLFVFGDGAAFWMGAVCTLGFLAVGYFLYQAYHVPRNSTEWESLTIWAVISGLITIIALTIISLLTGAPV